MACDRKMKFLFDNTRNDFFTTWDLFIAVYKARDRKQCGIYQKAANKKAVNMKRGKDNMSYGEDHRCQCELRIQNLQMKIQEIQDTHRDIAKDLVMQLQTPETEDKYRYIIQQLVVRLHNSCENGDQFQVRFLFPHIIQPHPDHHVSIIDQTTEHGSGQHHLGNDLAVFEEFFSDVNPPC
ncbi:hypothetical protein DFH06DRAFT_1294528 [Mycena polygramma]|nr:hypothetical protein DFH06DRAFT_1294528 [Mycena polygramma]